MKAHSHEHAPGVDCTSAARELWDYLDQELTPDRMEALHSHFTRCKPCLKNVEWGRQFLDALKSCGEKDRGPRRPLVSARAASRRACWEDKRTGRPPAASSRLG
jgi:anti-sigma factor (TIGR02949 family)